MRNGIKVRSRAIVVMMSAVVGLAACVPQPPLASTLEVDVEGPASFAWSVGDVVPSSSATFGQHDVRLTLAGVDGAGSAFYLDIRADQEFGYGPWFPINEGVSDTFDIAALPFRVELLGLSGLVRDQGGNWVVGPDTVYSQCASHELSVDPNLLPLPGYPRSGATGSFTLSLPAFSEQPAPLPGDPPLGNVPVGGAIDIACPGQNGAADVSMSATFRVVN